MKLTISAQRVPGVSWKKYFVKDGKRIIDGPFYEIKEAMAAKERIRARMTNPGTGAGWIKVNAIRQLPSGDIQLALPKGTMSNPGKRKSLLKSVGKVFGKVVGAGRKVIGNPSHLQSKEFDDKYDAETFLLKLKAESSSRELRGEEKLSGITIKKVKNQMRWFVYWHDPYK